MAGGRGGRPRPRQTKTGIFVTGHVDESSTIRLAQQLEEFRAGDVHELVLPTTLTKDERAFVHDHARRLGLISKSSGKGATRAVRITKRSRSAAADLYELPVGPEAQQAMSEYMQRYPPTLEELQAAAVGAETNDLSQAYGQEPEEHEGGGGRNGRSRKGKCAASFSREEVQQRHSAWQSAQASPSVAPLAQSRRKLPIAEHREAVLEAIRGNQVTLIAGETGCGKTTQVPQYLVEDSWSRGEPCRVLCTQPRRISAVSVAERVAAERGDKVGEGVGYTIRLETRGGRHCPIMFCTNGVLLRMITAGEGLADLTHILVDEIHERDKFADFLMIVLRNLLPRNPNVRLVLMSATLHVDLYSAYFGGCPVVRVPGFMHPVEDLYLEDCLRVTGYEEAVVAQAKRGAGGAAGSGTGAQQVSAEERSRVEAAIMAAFVSGSDADFDELLEVCGAAGADDMREGAPCVNVTHAQTGATALMAAAVQGRLQEASCLLSQGADPQAALPNGQTAADLARMRGHQDIAELLDLQAAAVRDAEAAEAAATALSHYQQSSIAEEVDLGLIEKLLEFVCGEGPFAAAAAASSGGGGVGTPGPGQEGRAAAAAGGMGGLDGSVLVFMPGWDEIIRTKELLEKSAAFGSSSRYLVLPLHSQVSPAEQRKVFQPAPGGARKIVLATNIAETAITIDDVVCVINAGRMKEKSYDPFTGVSTLQSTWISRASEKQRRGRAGRCRPGLCFHLYSRQRSNALIEYQAPEMSRSPLDEVCLQVKLLTGGPGWAGTTGGSDGPTSIAAFLAQAVEPPLRQAVEGAVAILEDIGALDENEQLTVLGRHLAGLPLPPRLGKLLMFGILFHCLDPMLTAACAMAYRDPWVIPMSSAGRGALNEFKQRLCEEVGGASDHLLMVRAYETWKGIKTRSGEGAARGFCSSNSLSPSTMFMIDGMRQQLASELISRRLIRSVEDASTNARHAGLVRCVLACGLYPMVGRLVAGDGNPGPGKRKPAVITRKDERVRIHQCSINSAIRPPAATPPPQYGGGGRSRYGGGGEEEDEEEGPGPCSLMAFDELTRGDGFLYLRQCTSVSPLALVLISSHLAITPDTPENYEEDNGDGGGGGDAMQTEGSGGQSGGGQGGGGQGGEDMDMSADTAVLVVDSWLRLRVPMAAVGPLACLRLRLAAAFAAKVQGGSGGGGAQLGPPLHEAILAVQRLFYAETAGLAGSLSGGDYGGGNYGPGGSRKRQHYDGYGGGRGGGGGRFGGRGGGRHGSWRQPVQQQQLGAPPYQPPHQQQRQQRYVTVPPVHNTPQQYSNRRGAHQQQQPPPRASGGPHHSHGTGGGRGPQHQQHGGSADSSKQQHGGEGGRGRGYAGRGRGGGGRARGRGSQA